MSHNELKEIIVIIICSSLNVVVLLDIDQYKKDRYSNAETEMYRLTDIHMGPEL